MSNQILCTHESHFATNFAIYELQFNYKICIMY